MASSNVENIHLNELKQILSESGIECRKSIQVTPETVSLLGEEEHAIRKDLENYVPIEIVEEEQPAIPEEESIDEPHVFPTPSLRKVLPERIRKLEEFNRLHILPEKFNTSIDPALIPKIARTPPKKYIDMLAELVGCEKYRSSLAEYWFLDTLANLLRRGQEDGLDRPSQAVLILWFCEWMKEIQYFDAADRDRMLRRFEENMLTAAQYIADVERLPIPSEIGVYYKERSDEALVNIVTHTESRLLPSASSKHIVAFDNTAYECSLINLTKITHYIFDLFSTDYQFELVRSVFTNTPQYSLTDVPYLIQRPKALYAQSKDKKKAKSPKKDKSGGDKKGKGKGAKKEELTLEFIALMELKAREEKELQEIEEREQEEWLRRSSILPLGMAANEEFFNNYWPPPPPEPEPVVAPPVVEPAKAKKGKK